MENDQLCLSSNQNAGFFDINICGKIHVVLQFFCKEVVINGSQQLRLPLLVGCGQVCVSSQIAGFFDYKYLRKESIDILEFLRGDNHQGKEAPETTILAGYGQLSFLFIQIAGYLIIIISGRNELISQFFLVELVIKGMQHLRLPFFGWVLPAVGLFQLNSRIQQYHWKEPINIFDFLHGDNYQQKVASTITTLAWR